MADTKISPAQLMQMAKLLKSKNIGEGAQVEQLAKTGLSDEQQAQLHAALQDKEALAQLINNPAAQALMKKLQGT